MLQRGSPAADLQRTLPEQQTCPSVHYSTKTDRLGCHAGTHGNVGQANYSTAKAGVLGLTRTVAKEWGEFNVRCNCVTYGFINTRLTQVPTRRPDHWQCLCAAMGSRSCMLELTGRWPCRSVQECGSHCELPVAPRGFCAFSLVSWSPYCNR